MYKPKTTREGAIPFRKSCRPDEMGCGMIMLSQVASLLEVQMHWLQKALHHLDIPGVKSSFNGRLFGSDDIDKIKALRDSGWKP